MAAQVLAGSGPVSYTNSTGQNVRFVINYLETKSADSCAAIMSFPGGTITLKGYGVYGKTAAYVNVGETGREGSRSEHAGVRGGRNDKVIEPIPLEIAMANGDTFSLTDGGTGNDIKGYNFIIIPEAG